MSKLGLIDILAISFMFMIVLFAIKDVKDELDEVKHMVNEVVCTALEMEEKYEVD